MGDKGAIGMSCNSFLGRGEVDLCWSCLAIQNYHQTID